MIKNILIDLDGTILNFNAGERKSFIKTIKEFSKYILKEEDILLFSEINERLFNEYASGKMIRIVFQEERFKEIFNALNISADASRANKFFIDKLKYSAELYDDVIDTLLYLNEKYNLYIASNGMMAVQTKRLETAGILHLFNRCYVSEAIGVNKPDIKFFNYIFNDLNNYNKEEFIIIGDRLETDIQGGINANIKTILINRDNVKGNIKPNYEIKSLLELKKLL